jgi:hypothetical protein
MRMLLPFLSTLFCCGVASAQGVILPPSTPSFGQDEFHASDGTSCRSSMDGAKRIEAAAYGTGSRYNDHRREGLFNGFSQDPTQNVGAYVRFSISLDARKKRMDCNRLYELELHKRELELNMMKQSLQAAEEKLRLLEGSGPGRRHPRR